MKFHEVFNEELLQLPKSIPNNSSFKKFLYQLFDKYLELIKDIVPEKVCIKGLENVSNFKQTYLIQGKFINGLKSSIEYYYNGQPAQAFFEFEKTLNQRLKNYPQMLVISNVSAHENFYRIRKSESNYLFKPNEMFHISYENRHKVSAQRYSINGFPTLYLSNALYLAWEELNRPELNKFQVIRFELQKELKILDLSISDWSVDYYNKWAYKFLLSWPLIAACSIKVKEKEAPFKAEYIIPQLLLQWVRNQTVIDGIKCNSSHLTHDFQMKNSNLYNLVLPVKIDKNSGLCPELARFFKSTDTVSWQILQCIKGNRHPIKADHYLIDDKIPFFELIKNAKYIKHKFKYSDSVLGDMELFLNDQELKKIL